MATASHMFPFMLTLPDGTLHDAVRIYGETLEAVAEWCGGEVGGAAIPGKGTVAGILYPTGKGHDAFAPVGSYLLRGSVSVQHMSAEEFNKILHEPLTAHAHPDGAADHRHSTPQRSRTPIRASRRPRAPQHGTQSRSQSPRSSQTSTRRTRTPTHRRRALGKAAIRLQLALPSSPTHQPPRRTHRRPMGTTHHPLHRNPLHVGPVRVEQQAWT